MLPEAAFATGNRGATQLGPGGLRKWTSTRDAPRVAGEDPPSQPTEEFQKPYLPQLSHHPVSLVPTVTRRAPRTR